MRRLPAPILLLSLLVAPSAFAETRECFSDTDCLPGHFCRGDEHSTRCEPRICTDEFAPVCGLNGYTYRNSCMASLQGIGVAYQGACGRCGGPAGHECRPGYFCDLDPGTCGVRAEGTCRPIPYLCSQEDHLVCGCDGRNYPNNCVRLMAPVSLAHDGACVVPKAAPPAPVKRKPAPPPGKPHSAPRRPVPRPQAPVTAPAPTCPPVVLYVPTPPAGTAVPTALPPVALEHSAEQAAAEQAAAEQAAAEKAAAEKAAKECLSNSGCEEGQYCQKPQGKCDGPGHCKDRPEDIPKSKGNPVCGCDGITYTNEEWATAAGQSIKCTVNCDLCK